MVPRKFCRARGGSTDRDPRLTLEHLERRACPAAVLAMAVREPVVFEGESVEVTLALSHPATTTEQVSITTLAQTATYGVDYFAPLVQQVTFAPGQRSQRISIPTLRDAPREVAEGVEFFTIRATPANPVLGTRALTVGIADYAPQPGISVADVRLNEGNSGTSSMTFVIALSGRYPKPVTVSYATRDGSATTANSDYVAALGTLVFAPGETVKTIDVAINGDRRLEQDETFSFVLSAPENGKLARSAAVGTIVNDEADLPGFQVALRFLDGAGGPVPQSVRTVAEQAVNRWARIITGDLEAASDNGIFIDDFEMSIQMGLLGGAPQGPGGVLANARPTAFRDNGTGLPYAGITGLDPSDIGNPALLLDTITHEMGHAFGFTPGATVFNRWIVGDTFVGANALREYNSIFAATATGVPLQAGVRAHWDETIFGNELMSPVTTGGPDYISRITIGALQDMGYTVNYAAAEPYVRPRATTGQTAAATGVTTVSAFASGSTATAKLSQPAAQTNPPAITTAAAAKLAVQPQKPAEIATPAATRPTTPPRPKAPAAVTAGGVAAAFSTLGRLA